MGSVIVFTDEGRESLGALGAGVGVEVFPLRGSSAALDSRDFDLAIIDCGSEPDAGLCLLREMKQDRPSVPVIFITGVSSEEVVIRAFKGGAREYFRKPVAPKELEMTVEMLLRFKRESAENSSPLRSDRRADSEAGIPLAGRLPEGILRAMRHIDSNLSVDIRLDALAGEACQSKFHFCRVFKHHIGMSPMQFIAARRVEKAKRFLRDASCTISMAAFRSGFNDLSDFSRQFKKCAGISPTSYRESCRIR